jgi:co-chaperonin GroES (HSP10)
MKNDKQVIVVGDRVLVKPDAARAKTSFGLYLPQGVESTDKVQGGYVTKVGPGYPMPDPNSIQDEAWTDRRSNEPKYLPLQAQEGDYALFVRKAAVEIELDDEKYLIVPQGAILLLLREDFLKRLSGNIE